MAQHQHAYMIMAHTQFETLKKLIRLLDHDRNEIYLHIDAKATGFDFDEFRSVPKRSRITFVPSRSVNWGGYSEIECELGLLKAASDRPHSYYHLLSGMDMPLMSAPEILKFFDLQGDREFVHFSPDNEVASTAFRVAFFHPLQERLRRSKRPRINEAVNLLSKCLQRAQGLAGVDRLRSVNFELKFGAQWFSITEPLVEHVLAQEPWIQKTFQSSLCASELFLQTVAFNSEFRDRLAGESLRLIDWERGDGRHPYIWRMDDMDELMSSNSLFARKFDAGVDEEIIDALYERIGTI